MPRLNSVHRDLSGRIIVVINGVRHTLTEDAFVALTQQWLNVMQAIVAKRSYPPAKEE